LSESLTEARKHGNISSDRMLDELRLARTGGPSLYDAIIEFGRGNGPHADEASFDPVVSFSMENGIEAVLFYSPERFDPQTIRAFAKHLVRVLEECIRNPQQSVGEITLLNVAEQQQLLLGWNQSSRPYPEKT